VASLAEGVAPPCIAVTHVTAVPKNRPGVGDAIAAALDASTPGANLLVRAVFDERPIYEVRTRATIINTDPLTWKDEVLAELQHHASADAGERQALIS
jgi:hypothetical protein